MDNNYNDINTNIYDCIHDNVVFPCFVNICTQSIEPLPQACHNLLGNASFRNVRSRVKVGLTFAEN